MKTSSGRCSKEHRPGRSTPSSRSGSSSRTRRRASSTSRSAPRPTSRRSSSSRHTPNGVGRSCRHSSCRSSSSRRPSASLLEWLVFRHLRTAPPVAGLVVAIGLTIALPAIVDIVMNFEPKTGASIEGIAPRGNNVFYDVFGHLFVQPQRARRDGRRPDGDGRPGRCCSSSPSIGLRMRAVVESPRMTELNGINADRVSAAAWALSSFFAGLAGVLIAPRFTTLAAGEFFNIVVVAIAAAAVGYLVSLPRAFLGGLGLGILIALFNTFIPKWSNDLTWLRPIQSNLTPAIPFIVLFGILVFSPKVRQTQRASDPLSGVDPPPSSQTHVATDSRRDHDPARARHRVHRGLRRRAVHPGRHGVDLPRHPGRGTGDRVPVDHGDDRNRPATSRCARAPSRPSGPSPSSSSPTASTCPSWSRRSSAPSSPQSSARCSRCRSCGSTASGSPSPRSPSPTSSTR